MDVYNLAVFSFRQNIGNYYFFGFQAERVGFRCLKKLAIGIKWNPGLGTNRLMYNSHSTVIHWRMAHI